MLILCKCVRSIDFDVLEAMRIQECMNILSNARIRTIFKWHLINLLVKLLFTTDTERILGENYRLYCISIDQISIELVLRLNLKGLFKSEEAYLNIIKIRVPLVCPMVECLLINQHKCKN